MRAIKLFLILWVTLLTGRDSFASVDCHISAEKVREYLELEFMRFDQTEGSGHRELGLKGCFLDAAKIIDVYNLHHEDKLQPWQKRVLYFHSGQSYAQSDVDFYSISIKRFEKSFNEQQEENPELAWNEYVHATIAFLEKNMIDLKKWRDKVAGSPTTGNAINLRVIDAMIKCFEKPYRIVYSPECIEFGVPQ